MAKYKCDCQKEAQWYYMPSSDVYKDNRYYCDDCVSSVNNIGCSCNWRHIDIKAPSEEQEIPDGIENKDWKWVTGYDNTWQYIDEKGRPYPCCEYDYNKEGFVIEDKIDLTEEQISSIENYKSFKSCDIYLTNGAIIKDEIIIEGSVWVDAELRLSNSDIAKIVITD